MPSRERGNLGTIRFLLAFAVVGVHVGRLPFALPLGGDTAVQSVQPPEQVQAAFEDTLKAGQDGDRLKKEGLAYASAEIPKAQGTAARLRQEAEGYKSRIVSEAEGDSERFARQLAEY